MQGYTTKGLVGTVKNWHINKTGLRQCSKHPMLMLDAQHGPLLMTGASNSGRHADSAPRRCCAFVKWTLTTMEDLTSARLQADSFYTAEQADV